MTALNTAGSTISNSSTYEQAIEELSSRIVAAQNNSANNPQGVRGVSFSTDSTTGQTSYEFALPLNVTASSTTRTFAPVNYLVGVSYTSGTPGTSQLTGGNMLQDLYNLLFDIQELEKNPLSNPTQADRLSLSIDDAWQLTGSLTLQTDVSLVSGKRTYNAIAYLA
jgi:hypothetical protein